MQKAVAKEGPRAPLFCLGAVLLLATSGTAAAQTVAQSDLELCASFATPELKLACFEALTAIEGKGAPSATGVAGSDAGRDAPAPAPVADDDRADVADDPGQETPDEIQADVAAELGQEHPDEEQVDLADELGREHLNENRGVREEKAVVRATVSEVVKGSYDMLYFHFTNGQVWRQVESRRFRYPREGEFEVIISKGMMGDYRLRLDEKSPMTRIRRIR